jgi:hypothetical protein
MTGCGRRNLHKIGTTHQRSLRYRLVPSLAWAWFGSRTAKKNLFRRLHTHTQKIRERTMGFFVIMTMQHQQRLLIAALLLLLVQVQGFYLPGVNPQAFAEDEP